MNRTEILSSAHRGAVRHAPALVLAASCLILLATARPALAAETASLSAPGSPAVIERASYSAPMQGIASWYGKSWQGHRTASGTRFNKEAMTAASHFLPLGAHVRVTMDGTARSVLVTITDRQGCSTRVIDLSMGAARRIGLLGRGTAHVSVQIL